MTGIQGGKGREKVGADIVQYGRTGHCQGGHWLRARILW
jgi:hypothetical protein